jgi:hypothetical protein
MAALQTLRRPFLKTIPGDSPSPSIGEAVPARALGVWVAQVLDLPIVQQPPGEDGYVSPRDGQITEFRTPARFGNVGLLAHSQLSGRFFSRLAGGQAVQLLYGNDSLETFVVTDILRYQALRPDDPYSSFRELGTEETLSAAQLFAKAYTGSRHVTFQTCIAAPGNPTWGRLFVIATHLPLTTSHPWN